MNSNVSANHRTLSPQCVTVLVIALLAAVFKPSTAGFAEGSLRIHWSPDRDHPKLLVIHGPAGAYRLLPLDSTPSVEHLFRGLPAGMARLDLHTAIPGHLTAPLELIPAADEPGLESHAGRLLASWEIPIGVDRITTVRIDSASGHLKVDDASGAPFGSEVIYTAWELQTLPHYGTEAVLPLDTRPETQADPILNGHDLRRQATMRPRSLQIDGDPSLVQIPLAGRSAVWGSRAMQAATYRPEAGFLTIKTSSGTQNHLITQGRLGFGAFLGARSPFEVDAALQYNTTKDAGPVGILEGRLKDNTMDAAEARIRAFMRPWGRGLAELEFYAFGQERRFYLHEFSLIPERAPRQDRADLLASLAYTLPLRSHALSLGLSFSRDYMETGDGVAYDNLEGYSIGGIGDFQDNTAASEDGLYWSPGAAGQKPHVYNYYTKHLIHTWQARADGRLAVLDHCPMRTGIEYSRSTYRWYEHSNPIAENPALRDENGHSTLDYASHLGYSWDPNERTDSGPHAPRNPTQISLFAAQAFAIGRGALEAGARLEHFRSGQKPLLSMVDPAGSNSVIDQTDLGDEPSSTGIDPRVGLYMPLIGGHFWADLVQSREHPPYDALYYSPNVLQSIDNQFRLPGDGDVYGSDLIFGNPALRPELRRSAHMGIQRPLGSSWSLTLSGTVSRTRDVWVARAYPNGYDFLHAYANEGSRRVRGLHAGIDYRPKEKTRLRLSYDISRMETNVIEPAPLYRGLILYGGPLEGTASRETAPLEPVWISDGVRDEHHPSLFDRTHRIAAAFLTRIDGEGMGSALAPLFRGSDFGLTIRAASGAPYTPIYIEAEGLMATTPGEEGSALTPGRIIEGSGVNSGRMPWTWTVDLGLRRNLNFWGGRWSAGLQVLNALDRKNPRRVYGATGEADNDGWLDTTSDPRARDEAFIEAYQDRLKNPWNYEDGIRARVELSYSY